MATRENQGLFIAVILLVLLSVVLAVATFFGFSGMREAADQRDSLQTQLDTTKKQSDGYMAQAGILKAMIGVGDVAVNEIPTYENQLITAGNQDLADETARIKEEYENDMDKIAANEDGSDPTYKNLIGHLTAAMIAQHNASTVLTNAVNEAELKLETEIAAKDKQLSEKDAQLVQSREDLTAEQQRHKQTHTEYKDLLDDAEGRFKASQTRNGELTTALANAQTNYKNDIEARDSTILEKEALIEQLTATETDVADGQIVSVSPILGKVVINLGSDDNLRLKQTFAVYDQAASRFKSGHGKAMIEVTKILDAHLAEARITSQDTVNPILTRDFVVTSTWDPGYSVPVAIVGRIDLDGDGFTDLQRLISIVEQTGYGKVVAYHDDEGNVFGEIDENTRFFVKGNDSLGKGTPAFKRLKTQRDKYQTREISVQEFLNEMGWRSEAKIQRFDENLPTTGFKPRQPGTQVEAGDPFESGN